jgi:hypothetical protein
MEKQLNLQQTIDNVLTLAKENRTGGMAPPTDVAKAKQDVLVGKVVNREPRVNEDEDEVEERPALASCRQA